MSYLQPLHVSWSMGGALGFRAAAAPPPALPTPPLGGQPSQAAVGQQLAQQQLPGDDADMDCEFYAAMSGTIESRIAALDDGEQPTEEGAIEKRKQDRAALHKNLSKCRAKEGKTISRTGKA